MGLTRIAITRPVFIFMLMLAAVLMGMIAYNRMRVEQNPEVQLGVVAVTVVYPGAGPDEMNTLVARKIEEAVSGVNGLREVTATSQESVSIVVCQFDTGTNMDSALNDLRAKVDSIANELPLQAEKPILDKFDFSSEPVLTLAIKSDTLNSQQLRDLLDDKIKDRFGQIGGVAGVAVIGGEVRELQVQVSKDKLLAYGLGILDVQRAVQATTMNVPSGRVSTRDKEYSVRVLGEFKTFADLANMVIHVSDPNNPMGKGQIVRLSDVATITDTTAERRSYSRLDGKDSVILSIQKSREGNAVEIVKAATAIIPSIESTYGLKIIKTFDQSTRIEESLEDVRFAILFGVVLVTLIVYVFLHNLRGTIIVGIAIPVCLLAAIMVLWTLGFTINNMSMLALSLAVGVLVDDAIVVLENIYRHLRMGEDPYTAAINGRGEIGLAAIAISLADVVVWVPVAFMGGIVGQFFKPLGVGFAVAVLLSLFVSFTVTPMLASRWYRKGEDMEHPQGRFAVWFEHIFRKFEGLYRRQLEWALNHRWFVFVSGFVALIGVIVAIVGSFKPTADAAMGPGLAMLAGSLAIGFLVYGINYWKRALSLTSVRRLYAGAVIVGLLVGPALPTAQPMPTPLKAILGMLALPVVLGVIAYIVNLLKPCYKARFILGAAAFGGVFILASLAGFGYAQWKQGPVFQFQFFPSVDSGKVSAKIELPPGASLSRTEAVVRRVEDIVSKHPDAKYVVSQVGVRGGGFSAADQGTNYAQVEVTLNDKTALLDQLMFWKKHTEKMRTRSDTSVAADMLERVGRIPGAQVIISATSGVGFGSPIQMSFASDDRSKLLPTATRIRDGLASGAVPGVINPDISSKPGKPELQAIPDRTRLADLGMTTSDVASSMRLLYEGNKDTKFRVLGREYDIRVMMDLKDRNNPQIVSEVPVKFIQGTPVFLSQVARLVDGVGVDKIERRDRQEEIRVTADLLPGVAAGSAQIEINNWLDKEGLIPNGVVKKELGQADFQQRESMYLFGALGLGLVLTFMLLASLYDNLLYPFIIQLAQPQAMVGALLALILTDKSLNIVGFVGIIALVGLVGKNAILLVDYTNTLRGRGRNRHDALVEAGPTRLRPIMMTTLAVILGMLPVALAIGRGSEFRETIGITIIGGIALSTVLTLLVIPCSYTIFDDMSLALGNLFYRRRHDHESVEAAHASEQEPERETGAPV